MSLVRVALSHWPSLLGALQFTGAACGSALPLLTSPMPPSLFQQVIDCHVALMAATSALSGCLTAITCLHQSAGAPTRPEEASLGSVEKLAAAAQDHLQLLRSNVEASFEWMVREANRERVAVAVTAVISEMEAALRECACNEGNKEGGNDGWRVRTELQRGVCGAQTEAVTSLPPSARVLGAAVLAGIIVRCCPGQCHKSSSSCSHCFPCTSCAAVRWLLSEQFL